MRTTTETVTTVARENGDPEHVVADWRGDRYALAAITLTVDPEGEDGLPYVNVRITGYKVSVKGKRLTATPYPIYGPITTVAVKR